MKQNNKQDEGYTCPGYFMADLKEMRPSTSNWSQRYKFDIECHEMFVSPSYFVFRLHVGPEADGGQQGVGGEPGAGQAGQAGAHVCRVVGAGAAVVG